MSNRVASESVGVRKGESARAPGRRSLLWTLAVPTCAMVGLVTGAVALFTPAAVVDAALDDAVMRSVQTARQMQTLRSFYSQNVVAAAIRSGTKASPTYHSEPASIPVPTTFVLDVAKAFSTDSIKVSLVSPYPWPTRAGRVLDGFETEAWGYLGRDPDGSFVRREQVGGRDVLRVAVGDRMDASCVSCHNSNPLSPKKDWKVGDVRGLIEVVTPMDAVTHGARRLSWRLVAGIVVGGSLLLLTLLVVGVRLIRPLRDLTAAIHRIAGGRDGERMPHLDRGDELGTVAQALESLREQTRKRAHAEAQITHMAHHDALTELPNRVLLHQELDHALARLQRDGEAVTPGAPYQVAGHTVLVGASVGVAFAPGDATSAEELLKAADMALYRAKNGGGGVYRLFEPEMDARMQARRLLEIDLHQALPNGEFQVYYQPIVSLREDGVSGFEALLRWRHPTRGMVAPADFIPLAEEIGAIAPIGAWVLRTACADAAGWPGDIKIAVNLSPLQFTSRTLVADVIDALASSGLPARRLELEITETVMLQDTTATLETLNRLRELGVRISMDDFGTGYSSLSYLRRFPFDKIKIDQCFIREMSEAHESVAVLRAIVGLGVSLGMTTTAEGVETRDQLCRLRAEGCTEVQGYFFSRPRPAEEVAGMLDSIARNLMPSVVCDGWVDPWSPDGEPGTARQDAANALAQAHA